MHIAHFLSHYPAPGGTTTVVCGLASALRDEGLRVTIHSSRAAFPPDTCAPGAGTDVRAGSIAQLKGMIGFKDRLTRAESRPDLLVIHGVFNIFNQLAARTALAAGIPYIACPHAMFQPELFWRRKRLKQVYASWLELPLMNRASAVQVPDERHVGLLRKAGVTTPIVVIPHGFYPPSPSQAPSRHEGRSNAIEFLYLGRLDCRTKGLDLLLEALALGRSDGSLPNDLHLTLAGPDGGGRARLEALANDLRLESCVRFIGPIATDDRWDIIRQCDVLVLPSRHDAFPNVILEAMAMSRPVIISTHTGITSTVVLAECGFVTEPHVTEIRRVMRLAIAHRAEWMAMGLRGMRYAFAHLTWRRIAGQAASTYEGVLRGTILPRNALRLELDRKAVFASSPKTGEGD